MALTAAMAPTAPSQLSDREAKRGAAMEAAMAQKQAAVAVAAAVGREEVAAAGAHPMSAPAAVAAAQVARRSRQKAMRLVPTKTRVGC